MFVMLRTNDGSVMEGLLLAVGKNTMRLAIPGDAETLELQLAYGEWTASDGSTYSLESMVHTGDLDFASIGYEVFAKTRCALN